LSTVTVATLGCKLNQFESESILAQFRRSGYTVVDSSETADVCVVNTCAVTAIAERKSRAALRSFRRRNPDARILAVGCMVEKSAPQLAQIQGVDTLLGNHEKQHLFDYLPSHKTAQPTVHLGETKSQTSFAESQPVEDLLGRTRAYLKVQDGCSQKCTYCVVPQLRGAGRSLAIGKAADQARLLADRGFIEIVLTGVALGTYGTDLGMTNGLVELLKALEKVTGIQRIRLSSVEPWAVSKSLLNVIANSEVICPHLHIPLQSAEDTVLHRMNRRYTTAAICDIFEQAFKLRDDWGFGSDIMVGFPGEGPTQFADTQKLIADSPLAYLHVFPYSIRTGTPATKLPDQVSDSEKQHRAAVMRELDQRLRTYFRRKHIGRTLPVLFEKRRVGTLLAGHAHNYLDVYAAEAESVSGSVRRVLVNDIHPEGVVGEIIS
jgi:threonylcarbamoyladenosine tRNA methylthiotransferase MtaB